MFIDDCIIYPIEKHSNIGFNLGKNPITSGPYNLAKWKTANSTWTGSYCKSKLLTYAIICCINHLYYTGNGID